jgi:hypothetical protein
MQKCSQDNKASMCVWGREGVCLHTKAVILSNQRGPATGALHYQRGVCPALPARLQLAKKTNSKPSFMPVFARVFMPAVCTEEVWPAKLQDTGQAPLVKCCDFLLLTLFVHVCLVLPCFCSLCRRSLASQASRHWTAPSRHSTRTRAQSRPSHTGGCRPGSSQPCS